MSKSISKWRSHINSQVSSGLGVSTYCQQHNLSEASFYKWRRRLSNESEQGGFDEASIVEEQEEIDFKIDLGQLDHRVLCVLIKSLVASSHA